MSQRKSITRVSTLATVLILSMIILSGCGEKKNDTKASTTPTVPTEAVSVEEIREYSKAESALGLASAAMTKALGIQPQLKNPNLSVSSLKSRLKLEKPLVLKSKASCDNLKEETYGFRYTDQNKLTGLETAYRYEYFIGIMYDMRTPQNPSYHIINCKTNKTLTPQEFDDTFRRPWAAVSAAASIGNTILLTHASGDTNLSQDDLEDTKALRPIEEIGRKPKAGEVCAQDDGYTQAYKSPNGKELVVATRLGQYVGITEYQLKVGMSGGPDERKLYRCL